MHPTAVVNAKAEIGSDTVIGPYSIVGPNVRIGEGCRVGAHAVIEGHTTIGDNNRIFTGAVVGAEPQDLKFKGGKCRLIIGDNNAIREYATISVSTSEEKSTRIGNDNLLMAYAHVAHDCELRDRIIMANGATLGGHVIVEDKVILGGLTAVHQFVRVGILSIVGGCTKATKDVMPYSMVDGHPARCHGVNFVGLKRSGMAEEARAEIKRVFKIICRSNLNTSQALEKVRAKFDGRSEINRLIEFIEGSSRGVYK
jgi:UDP-N-acetylglucosamine acyltransferase